MRIFVAMKNLIYCWLISCLIIHAQNETEAVKFSKLIRASGMEKNLRVLASDEYEGRETGKKGQQMAATYIAKHFQSCGAEPVNGSHFQSFNLIQHQPQQIIISDGKIDFQPTIDFFSPSAILKDSSFILNKIAFAGYGIQSEKYNDYKNTDTTATAVMFMRGEPRLSDNNFLLTQTQNPGEWSTNKRRKMELARQKGFKLVFIIEDDFDASFQENAHRIYSGRMNLLEDFAPEKFSAGMLVIHISKKMANQLLKGNQQSVESVIKTISSSQKSENFIVKTQLNIHVYQTHEQLKAENVLGYVEGSDLKNELVVITAHYDHLGVQENKIYNGADDDGSGTVAVMELAAAFAQAKKEGNGPRRSLLFMTVAGEEKGLLGSDYYSRHPVFPLKNTVANLNIDMIGRIDKEHEGNPDYVYIIGSNMLSNELHEINENCNNKQVKLQLDYTFNSADDPNRYYYRSDHYNFAKNNIPVIFYFNGVHEDYHQETDEVDKINFTKMEKITRLVFFTAWELSNRNERIQLNKK